MTVMETAETGAGVRPFRFTRETYHRLGELGVFRGHRVELFRGRIIEMGPMGPPHRDAIWALTDALVRMDLPGIQVGCQTPVPMPDGSEPEPDFTVAPRLVKGAAHREEVDALLLVEVSDSTLEDDLGRKATLYAEGEVPEYWVIDLNARETFVHRSPEQGVYTCIQRVPWSSPLASSAVPGLTLTLSEVLW